MTIPSPGFSRGLECLFDQVLRSVAQPMMSQGQQAVAELVAGHELSLKPARELDRAGDFSTVPSPRSHQGRLRWSHSAKRRVHRKKNKKRAGPATAV